MPLFLGFIFIFQFLFSFLWGILLVFSTKLKGALTKRTQMDHVLTFLLFSTFLIFIWQCN